MHTYAIGDIHGHIDLLKRAHDRIAADQARHGAAPIIHLGDLVDRGPDSRGPAGNHASAGTPRADAPVRPEPTATAQPAEASRTDTTRRPTTGLGAALMSAITRPFSR